MRNTFIVIIMICLGVIAYGVYAYIQDNKNLEQASKNGQSNNSKLFTEEVEGGENDNEDTSSFLALDHEIERSAKINLINNEQLVATDHSDDPLEINMTISFSAYEQAEQAFSAGIIVANNHTGTIQSCNLEINTASGQNIRQEVDIVDQSTVSGCRFNDVDLSPLTDPSPTNFWQIAFEGNNISGDTSMVISREITSFNELNSLMEPSLNMNIGRINN